MSGLIGNKGRQEPSREQDVKGHSSAHMYWRKDMPIVEAKDRQRCKTTISRKRCGLFALRIF